MIIPVYGDLATNKVGMLLNDEYIEMPINPVVMSTLHARGDCVTIGEWAATLGYLFVKNIAPKETFKTLGLPGISLELRVRYIDYYAKCKAN